MKNIHQMRLTFLLLLLNLCVAVGAVSLPNQSYMVYNPLYEANQDNVSMSYGTVIKGINHVLKSDNESWGTSCVDEYGAKSMECRACCGEKLEEIPLDQQAAYAEMHSECLTLCNTGLPLGGAPLDIPLWFIMPLCGVYAALQRIRNKKKED